LRLWRRISFQTGQSAIFPNPRVERILLLMRLGMVHSTQAAAMPIRSSGSFLCGGGDCAVLSGTDEVEVTQRWHAQRMMRSSQVQPYLRVVVRGARDPKGKHGSRHTRTSILGSEGCSLLQLNHEMVTVSWSADACSRQDV
jgi:hypothetical protein